MKVLHVLKAIGSGIIWGLGQLCNKQYLKAAFFFLIMVACVGLELGTGNYFKTGEYDIYQEKIAGEYFANDGIREHIAANFAKSGIEKYVTDNRVSATDPSILRWNEFYNEKGQTVTIDDIVSFTGSEIRKVYDDNADKMKAAEDPVKAEEKANEAANKETNDAKREAAYNRVYAETITAQRRVVFNNEVSKNKYLLAFQTYMNRMQLSAATVGEITDNDWNEMLIRIYYAAFPEKMEELVDQVHEPIYEKTGFFIHGIWGLFTLGTKAEVPLTVHYESDAPVKLLLPNGVNALKINLAGHNSVNILIEGILAVIVIVYMAIIYVWNIRDAYNSSKKLAANKGAKESEIQYFKDVYEGSFEYIVLTPALVLMSFVTLMPIVFSFLIAFTNYSIKSGIIPPNNLISWVGLENFTSLFNAGENSINFGDTFWKVLSWTLIWSVGATFTCFFGGFIQAVILNNKRVVFRKAWRTILILPWAIPAMVSQMMFKLFFDDLGAMNQFIQLSGLNDLLTRMGFLGRTLTSVSADTATFFDRITWFGTDYVMWIGNSNTVNPWLPRIFIIVLNIWLGFPYFMAMMSGIMTSISKDLYEAAEIDGATAFQQFKSITMPLVLYSTAPLLIMTFSSNFNNFGVIYFITGGGPNIKNPNRAYAGDTDILISWIYSLTTDSTIGIYNTASVFSILIFLIVGSISTWNFLRTKSFQEEDMM